MRSAYSRATRSFSSYRGLVAYSSRARIFSSGTPSSLLTAAFRSCQNSQPFMAATRRFMRETSLPSMRPEESSPAHIARTPRKMVGRLAYNRWFRSGAPHFLVWALKTAFIGPGARSGSTPSILATALPPFVAMLLSVVEDRQVELAEALGVGEDVDLDDLPPPDREAHDRKRPSTRSHDDSYGSVHERQSYEWGEP